MVKYRTRTIWKERNRVGVPEKFVKLAFKEGIEIKYLDKAMTLRADEIEEKIVGRSERPFADKKIDGGFYHLIYFDWCPDDANQEKLL